MREEDADQTRRLEANDWLRLHGLGGKGEEVEEENEEEEEGKKTCKVALLELR